MFTTRCHSLRLGLALVAAVGVAAPARSNDAPEKLAPVPRDQLCVTEGTLTALPDGDLSVEAAKMRAVMATTGPRMIEARFLYLGPTAETAPLRSGEVRQQFGLKLRASDGCNVIYAMWRFEPRSSLTVSVKSNPGLHTSSACGNAGYETQRPRLTLPVQAPQIGTTHRLTAALNDRTLSVLIDEIPVWEGELAADALASDGPVGLRSDNVRLELALTAPPAAAHGSCPRPGAEDED